MTPSTIFRLRCPANLIHGGTKALTGVLALLLGAVVAVASPRQPADVRTGAIAGVVSYPSEALPPMHVYALAVDGAAHFETATRPGQSRFTIVGVPPGTYHVVAYTQDEPRLSGGWSRAVPCGLKATCTDHSLMPVTVAAGRTAGGIRVADWYAPPGTFPAEPAAAVPAQTPPGGIRSVDFRNFTFAPKGAEPLTLHGGREDAPDGSYLVSVRYADFDGDGEDDALVTVGTGKKDAGGYSEDYYLYLERSGRPHLAWHASREKPQQVRIEGRSIVIVAPFWKTSDPGCCPSATETAVYRWRGGRFVRVSRTLTPRH